VLYSTLLTKALRRHARYRQAHRNQLRTARHRKGGGSRFRSAQTRQPHCGRTTRDGDAHGDRRPMSQGHRTTFGRGQFPADGSTDCPGPP
jgi:hypothetical protein